LIFNNKSVMYKPVNRGEWMGFESKNTKSFVRRLVG
jgi:hypothetical protein